MRDCVDDSTESMLTVCGTDSSAELRTSWNRRDMSSENNRTNQVKTTLVVYFFSLFLFLLYDSNQPKSCQQLCHHRIHETLTDATIAITVIVSKESGLTESELTVRHIYRLYFIAVKTVSTIDAKKC